MFDSHYYELLSNIQLLQDLLSENLDLFLVLIDHNYNELTLPSKLPLLCYENAFNDTQCKNCIANYFAVYKNTLHDKPICKCHRNLYFTAFKTNITLSKPIYLVSGRTNTIAKLKNNLDLIQAIFSLPVNLKDSCNLTSYSSKNSSDRNFGLTQQESVVLFHLVEGLTNQDIAAKLCISLSTVKTHIAHILSKLNVSNRTEASIFAVQNGLIRVEKK